MTNAEKYLKEGTDIKKFAEMIDTTYVKADKYADVFESTIKWLNEPTKPTLTEDERVILRNIPMNFMLYRNSVGGLELRDKDKISHYEFYMYDRLFQFIKERRRI